MLKKTIAQFSMLIGGMLMGFVGLFVSGLSIIPIFAIVSLRGLFATLFLCIFLLSTKNFHLLLQLFRLAPVLIVIQALLTVITVLFYFYSIQSVGYAYAAFLLYLGPILAVLFNWILFKKRPRPVDLLAFIIALTGILFLTELWSQSNFFIMNSTQRLGIISGICSGISLGLCSTSKIGIYEKIRNKKNQDPNQLDFFGKQPIMTNLSLATFSTVALFGVFFIPSFIYYPILGWIHWIIAIGLGLIPTAIAFTCVNYGLLYDEGGDVLIFSYSEPIIGAILTAFLQNGLSLELLIGGSLIIMANLLIIMKQR